ncbi:hypothetical protein [Klebsiella phage Kpn02]|uniref:Uncharacterized protein n=1 Tax=Klebsiella phage Kpn02 TaxID=3044023 RepID=A0AAT9V693_9CAUD|nr:hypothetical protein [Klebsiella phage Kpn02]
MPRRSCAVFWRQKLTGRIIFSRKAKIFRA